jgi:hypothetical protein
MAAKSYAYTEEQLRAAGSGYYAAPKYAGQISFNPIQEQGLGTFAGGMSKDAAFAYATKNPFGNANDLQNNLNNIAEHSGNVQTAHDVYLVNSEIARYYENGGASNPYGYKLPASTVIPNEYKEAASGQLALPGQPGPGQGEKPTVSRFMGLAGSAFTSLFSVKSGNAAPAPATVAPTTGGGAKTPIINNRVQVSAGDHAANGSPTGGHLFFGRVSGGRGGTFNRGAAALAPLGYR